MSAEQSATRKLHLFRGQIRPRLRHLIASWVTAVALALSVGLTVALPHLPSATLPIQEAANVGVTYASISMGACIAAIVLSIGLTGPDRLRRWATMDGRVAGHSALSDLVFVVVWAALAQVSLVVVCIFALAFGAELPLAPAPMPVSHALGVWLGLFVLFYAVFELVVVVQTLSQMAVIVIDEEQKNALLEETEQKKTLLEENRESSGGGRRARCCFRRARE